MTPTLAGRLQTRIVLLATVGLVWTLVVTPLLPAPAGADLGDRYATMLTALAVVAGLGLGWELVYHGLQQFRWEKDWPALFGLLVAVPEGVAAYLVTDAVRGVTPAPFLGLFVTMWLLVWFVANGPLRVVALRWRYRGGRFV